MLVAADLLNRGIEVFRSLTSRAYCDLIAVVQRQCIRIEVKSRREGFPKPPTKSFFKGSLLRFDVLATYDPQTSTINYYKRTGIPMEWIQKEASRP